MNVVEEEEDMVGQNGRCDVICQAAAVDRRYDFEDRGKSRGRKRHWRKARAPDTEASPLSS